MKQDLRQKVQLVIRGHMEDHRDNDVYSFHMKHELSHILMNIADLNGLEVAVGDISNTYLYAKDKKIWTSQGEASGRDIYILTLTVHWHLSRRHNMDCCVVVISGKPYYQTTCTQWLLTEQKETLMVELETRGALLSTLTLICMIS